MNKITLIGNLGRDPEMSYTPNGIAVTKFSIAVNRRVTTPSGEKQNETDWYNISAWRQQAETCNTYLHKGNKVYIEGRLVPRRYTDRAGVERTSLDVTLTDVEFLTPKETRQSDSDDADALGSLDDHPF
jgi:single-strand DNA-binding protein